MRDFYQIVIYILFSGLYVVAIYLTHKIFDYITENRNKIGLFISFALIGIVVSAICALIGVEIPKFLLVSATLFSTFWGLSEIADYSSSPKRKKIIGGLQTAAIISLIAVPIFYKYFNGIETSPIELMSLFILLLGIALKEKIQK
jgi:hypothetical protein